MSLPIFDVRAFSLDDVIECLSNSGFICDPKDFEFARYNDAFKYNRFFDGQHKFLIGFVSDTIDISCYVSKVYIKLGAIGYLIAEYEAMPCFEGTEDEVLDYLKQTCN
jgi:hypothetical protein